MLKGRLPRVIYHEVNQYTKKRRSELEWGFRESVRRVLRLDTPLLRDLPVRHVPRRRVLKTEPQPSRKFRRTNLELKRFTKILPARVLKKCPKRRSNLELCFYEGVRRVLRRDAALLRDLPVLHVPRLSPI